MCECLGCSSGLHYLLYIITLLIAVSVLGILVWTKIKFKRLSAGMCGVATLTFHILVFSVVTIISKYLNVNLVSWFAHLLPYEWLQHVITYSSWCSAILIQTLIEVLLMVLLVVRRQMWTRNLLTS